MAAEDNEFDRTTEQVNEAVNDGGGCVEAWEAMSSLRDENDAPTPDRRMAIKLFGAGAASMAGLSGLTNRASADETTKSPPTPNQITGPKAKEMVSVSLQTDIYEDIENTLWEQEQYVVEKSDPTVLEVSNDDGEKYQIVTFSLKEAKMNRGSGEDNENIADMSVTVHNGEAVRGEAALFTSGATSNSSNTQESSIPISATTYKSTGGAVKSNTTEGVIEEESADNEITPSSSNKCFACTVIGDAVCAIGCGIGITAACATSAVVNLGLGTACSVIGGAFCTILAAGRERYTGVGCSGDVAIEFTCYHAGYCNNKPY